MIIEVFIIQIVAEKLKVQKKKKKEGKASRC